jgi:hypothetical protein
VEAEEVYWWQKKAKIVAGVLEPARDSCAGVQCAMVRVGRIAVWTTHKAKFYHTRDNQ